MNNHIRSIYGISPVKLKILEVDHAIFIAFLLSQTHLIIITEREKTFVSSKNGIRRYVLLRVE
jgi:hypothetical protein